MDIILSPWTISLLILIPFLLFYQTTFKIFGIIVIPANQLGIVSKKFKLLGSNRTLPDGVIVALNGEAGLQADTLPPGIHFGYWPWQYDVKNQPFVTIEDGFIGIVESREGVPIPGGRILGRKVDCDSFQNAREFITQGGERGPQITFVPPGTYRINQDIFSLRKAKVSIVPEGMIGIVTTREGQSLPPGVIAGVTVDGHGSFQDAQEFIHNGGYKGLQEQVVLPGNYFHNPLFMSMELADISSIPIAHAGVVISSFGESGNDVTGPEFTHGNLVRRGQRGVWVETMDPGRYPINLKIHKIENVPTANIVLNWATNKSEAHKLDQNLSSITVRSADGFTFNLDVSQIIHISATCAPKVIARFGNVENLVTQVLEPVIGNYFRNAAQKHDVISFLAERMQRQSEAREHIAKALGEYDVQAVDTLIGDINPPAALMKTLTDRKIAEQEEVTFSNQEKAQVARKRLAQAQAIADTQPEVVSSERRVEIAKFDAASKVEEATGLAKSKTMIAEADARVATIQGEAAANVTMITGNAEASKILAIGEAEAKVTTLKSTAIGPENYTQIAVMASLAQNQIKLVPDVIAGAGGNLLDVLMGKAAKS